MFLPYACPVVRAIIGKALYLEAISPRNATDFHPNIEAGLED